MIDVDKIVEYWSSKALETLEYLKKQQAETRNPEVAKLVARNMEILCSSDKLMDDESAVPPAAAAGWDTHGADGAYYEDAMPGTSGARGRGRHYVRAHYSYAMPDGGDNRRYSQGGGTISRMMAAADPREREILERLLRKSEE